MTAAASPSRPRVEWAPTAGDGACSVGGARVPDPPGFAARADALADASSSSSAPSSSPAARRAASASTRGPTPADKQAALMARATGTFKSVGFLCFMMWMSGSQIHLFSIMMTASGIYQPLMAILKSGEAFPADLADGGAVDVLTPRLVFCAVQAGGLLFALSRLNGMGLLPTRAADWAAGLPPAVGTAPAGGAVALG